MVNSLVSAVNVVKCILLLLALFLIQSDSYLQDSQRLNLLKQQLSYIRKSKLLYGRIQRTKIINFSSSPKCGGSVVHAKIVGGTGVRRGEFPFLVSIKNSGVHFCGGSIISEWYILTAAHCLVNRNLDDLSITVREYDMSTEEGEYFSYDILPTQVVVHSKFVLQTYDNDIALIRLADPIRWDKFTQPVCLPDRSKKILAGKTGILVGWGRKSEEGVRSALPLKLEVPIVTMKACTHVLGKKNVNPAKFCAGFLQGGRDACQGDSGGPLVTQFGSVYVQEGIISSGVGCARADLYGLYTRMSEFIPWLRTAMNRTAKSSSDLHFNVSDIYASDKPQKTEGEMKTAAVNQHIFIEKPPSGAQDNEDKNIRVLWSANGAQKRSQSGKCLSFVVVTAGLLLPTLSYLFSSTEL